MDRDKQRREEWPNLEANTGSGTAPGAGGGTPSGSGKAGDITRELQELGRQLASTARAAWQSEQRQEIQQEMTEGIRSIRDQLADTVESLRTNPRAQTMTQSMKEQVGKAAETTRVTEIVDDVRGGLVSGLRELNDQLRRVAERLEHRDDRAASTDAAVAGSAVSSVGGQQTTTPSTGQITGGAHAGRPGGTPETAGTVVGAGLMNEEPVLAPDAPIAGASQADLERLGRGQDQRQGLPDQPEGPAERSPRAPS